jgi:hypothetical protein
MTVLKLGEQMGARPDFGVDLSLLQCGPGAAEILSDARHWWPAREIGQSAAPTRPVEFCLTTFTRKSPR